MIVSFSGIDCSGKGTQIRHLYERLKEKKRKPIVIWSRIGYTPRFEAMKKWIRMIFPKTLTRQGDCDKSKAFVMSSPLVSGLWLFIAFLDMFVEYAGRVRTLEFLGYDVILDRYIWDSGIDLAIRFERLRPEIWRLWHILEIFSPKPQKAFLLHIPLDKVEKRMDLKGERFRETKETLSKRYELYERLAGSGQVKVIDADRDQEEISKEIFEILGV